MTECQRCGGTGYRNKADVRGPVDQGSTVYILCHGCRGTGVAQGEEVRSE